MRNMLYKRVLAMNHRLRGSPRIHQFPLGARSQTTTGGVSTLGRELVDWGRVSPGADFVINKNSRREKSPKNIFINCKSSFQVVILQQNRV